MKIKTLIPFITLATATACGATAGDRVQTTKSTSTSVMEASLIPPVSITRDSTTTTTVATTLSDGQRIGKWYQSYGLNVATDIKADMDDISSAADDYDVDQLASACAELVDDATDAQGLPAIPQPEVEAHWREALTQFRIGGTACVVGAETGDADAIQQASDHFAAGGEALTAASDKMEDM